MIYVDNTNEYSQRIYIPKDEADATSGVTGHTITLQDKDYIITQNGTTRIHADAGYDGISGGTIGVYVSAATGVTFEHLDVTEDGLYVPTGDSVYTGVTVQVYDRAYQEGYQDGFQAGYNSGYTEGYSIGSADGYDAGYSSGHTDGFNEGYASGHTDGYASGHTDGYAEGKVDGYSDGYAAGNAAGYAEGYQVGYSNGYNAGYADGEANQKAKLEDTTITANGTYTKEDGWSAVTVNVASGPYEDGYQDGIEYQKSLLGSYNFTANTGPDAVIFQNGISAATVNIPLSDVNVTATTNGQYNYYASDGLYSSVQFTVNVPQTGSTPTLTSGYFEQNGQYFPPAGFDGFSSVNVLLNTAQTYNDGYQNGYSSGVTHGFQEGVDYQKGLLSSDTFSNNGTFTRENGWSSVTINVNTASTYNEGYSDGYSAATEYQKSLLGSTALTWNGTFTKETGWSAVTVNVPTNYQTQNYGVTVHSNYMPGLLDEFKLMYTGSTGSQQGETFSGVTALTDSTGRLVFKSRPGFKVDFAFVVPSGYNAVAPLSGFTYWERGWKYDVTCNTSTNENLAEFTATTVNGINAHYDTKYDGSAEKVTMYYDKETDGSWTASTSPRNAQSITFTNNKWLFNYASGDTVAIKRFGPHRVFWVDSDLQTLEFPVSVKSLGNSTYAMCFNCTSLKSVSAPGCTRVGNTAFGNCSALTSVTLSDNLYRIDYDAFSDCTNLESVNTSNVEVLEGGCFQRTKLKSIDLSNVHTYQPNTSPVSQAREGWLAPGICYFCEYLTAVTIGSQITEIMGDSFYHCGNLSRITCLATTAPNLRLDYGNSYYAFDSISSTGTLRVPRGSDYSSWLARLGSGWTVQYI